MKSHLKVFFTVWIRQSWYLKIAVDNSVCCVLFSDSWFWLFYISLWAKWLHTVSQAGCSRGTVPEGDTMGDEYNFIAVDEKHPITVPFSWALQICSVDFLARLMSWDLGWPLQNLMLIRVLACGEDIGGRMKWWGESLVLTPKEPCDASPQKRGLGRGRRGSGGGPRLVWCRA